MPIRDNVIDFKADLDAAAAAFHMTLEQTLKSICFELLRMIVIQTPVDTGRAAGSWMLRGGSADSFVLPESAHMSRDAAVSAVLARVTNVDFSDIKLVYWIYNNLPYIEQLEYGLYPNPPARGSWVPGQGYVIKTVGGYSKQAPAGMVRISVASLEIKIASIIRAAQR